ncbi:19902_t:CDS:2 [Dentiscutata erythropus]|uniref:19902_t:CDS:1 n=1 Tax=Dentiscutata erythropus TaxID=1348616 RepID=A0A9N9CYQ1_9GLOM|nr:19902_t:CDS:2 [Dentiscutata erythropus]
MSDQIQVLRTLINTLDFTEEEKIALRKYFIGNEKRQNDTLAFLPDCPTDDTKSVFLRSLIPTPTQMKIKITDAFHGGLLYMKPEPLLYTSGLFDKLNLPIYLFLSGAGTGKSRNANEFHQTAITCLLAQEDEELLTRIKEAWVFHVTYENGFGLREDESRPYYAIGTRMLFRDKMTLNKIIETYEPPDPLVVTLIAKHHNQDLRNVTAILVIDGIQQLMESKDDGLKLNSIFYKTLTSIADLAFSGIFMIPVCTSTIAGPIDGMLRYSTRDRVYLPVASLQPPNYKQGIPVFKNDVLTNILVEDCGGHGRALEVLNDCLAGRSIEECNVDTLMNELCHNLTKKYCDAIFVSVEEARPIARAILTKRLLNRYKPIPKTDKTPDEFVGSGLIRFEQVENSLKRYLTAPYIWLWIFVEMSQQLGDPILQDWGFADYEEQRALLNPVTLLQAKTWQSFEKFVASFRCIKSAVIEEDELITISEVHAGAHTRSKTLTASEWNVDCYNSTVDVRQFRHCIINALSSPYGDSFLSLDQLAVSKKQYQEEREKSASENDFFILFTTANCNIEIPKRSEIVDKNTFTSYFGPFAGRAYRSAMAPSIYNNKVKNIYTVSLGQIYFMNQISKEQVNAKTKIPMKNFYFRKGLNMISHILM